VSALRRARGGRVCLLIREPEDLVEPCDPQDLLDRSGPLKNTNACSSHFCARVRGEQLADPAVESMNSRAQSNFDDELLVAVVDGGVGIRPDPDRRGLGFGLSVMAALATSLTIEHPPKGGTQVEGRFPLARPG
jgi:hypothetical protein